MRCAAQSKSAGHRVSIFAGDMGACKRRLGIAGIFSILLFLFTINSALTATAQSDPQTPFYWRYDAVSQISEAVIADVNHDGIDEFLIVSANNIALIEADGEEAWSFTTSAAISQILPLNFHGASAPQLEIGLIAGQEIILLNSLGKPTWRQEKERPPAQLAVIEPAGDGRQELIVSFAPNLVERVDEFGEIVWEYPIEAGDNEGGEIHLTTLPAGNDEEENLIAIGYITPDGFTEIALVNTEGEELWSSAISGRISDMEFVAFDGEPPALAVATRLRIDRAFVNLFDSGNGRQIWFRTPNREITVLSSGKLRRNGEAVDGLIVGTNAGVLLAYDKSGRRLWDVKISDAPDQQIVAISPSPITLRQENRLALAVTTRKNSLNQADQTQTLLFTYDHTPLQERYLQTNGEAPPQLTDINRDGSPELMLTQASTLTLLDPDSGVREIQSGNEYRLNAAPQAALIADINQDDKEELIIAAGNGNLHYLENRNNFIRNRNLNLGTSISHIAALPNDFDSPPDIVAAYTDFSGEAHIAILGGFGQRINDIPLADETDAILIADLDGEGRPEIVVGGEDGSLAAFSAPNLNILWEIDTKESIKILTQSQQIDSKDLFVAYDDNPRIDQLSPNGELLGQIEGFIISPTLPKEIAFLEPIPPEGFALPGSAASQAKLLIALDNGVLQWIGSNNLSAPNRERSLNGLITFVQNDGNAFMIATDLGQYLRLSFENDLLWQLADLGEITALFWGDLNGDITPDLAVGSRSGQVSIFADNGVEPWDQFQAGQEVVFIGALSAPDRPDDLALITTNGLVQQYRANRAPLLVKPETTAHDGQYNVSLVINDQENDRVQITLEALDENGEWAAQGNNLIEGQGRAIWSIDPLLAANGLQYRFRYFAGTHSGVIGPFEGVTAIVPPNSASIWEWGGAGLAIIFLGAVLGWGVQRSDAAQAWLIYRRIERQSEQTLDLLALTYRREAGSPDFLLNLGNRARQKENQLVAGLADGLFLLADRPEAAFSLINETLTAATDADVDWDYLDLWRSSCRFGQQLLEAPSITELGLLLPQLEMLLDRPRWGQDSLLAFDGIMPIMSSLRDSGRVDMADDRLVYLYEAQNQIKALDDNLSLLPTRVSTDIGRAVCGRLEGMVNAGIEELRGQVALTVSLKTKQLAALEAGTMVTLEIANTGRAPAEEISVKLLPDPSYEIMPKQNRIRFLLPGWSRRIDIPLKPLVSDRFRVAVVISFTDRHQRRKSIQFGDMVHLISPQRDFSQAPNPYLPGTPLRRNSPLFVGRTNLFRFIAENVTRPDQRNVLILVGQRRAGKTSALLRLDQQLPEHIATAYIDCQSLGVTPGMPALLHDIAWFISDALATRGLELPVPPIVDWQSDPAGKFQRKFIPQALAMMPAGNTLLLVFDEFEALENLVNDGILPHTLFSYLRHLMQHLKGVSFIFAGARGLEEMSADYWSALFNIALYRQMGFLDDESAIRLITEPVAPELIYDDLALNKILRVTAGHPYFLQLVCYTLVNRANQEKTGYITINNVNDGLDEMLRLGEAHFAYLWRRSSLEEKVLLTAIAHLMDRELPFRPEEILDLLREYGIKLSPAEGLQALNSLVEREILTEIVGEATTLYELKIGLVGLWIAGNKSLSKLFEEGAAREPISA